MDLQLIDQEIDNVFNTYETSKEKRIRYISGMHHFAEYLNSHNIELNRVGEEEIQGYSSELKSAGYPDIFVDTNVTAIRKYFSYPKRRNYITEEGSFIG